MNQSQLAEKLGCTPAAISNWKKDDRSGLPYSVKISYVVSLAQLTGRSLEDLGVILEPSPAPIDPAPPEPDPSPLPRDPKTPLIVLIWIVGLAHFVLAGVVPRAALWAGFPIQEADLFTKVYAHLFLYPFYCGWMVSACLVAPFASLVRWSRDPRDRRPKAAAFLAVWVVTVLVVVGADFFQGDHALWEVARNAPGRAALMKHFEAPNQPGRQAFADGVNRLINGGRVHWSAARWLYPVGNLLQVAGLIAIPFLSVAMYFAKVGSDEPRSTLWIMRALFIGSAWLLMRQFFLHEKATLYPRTHLSILDGFCLLLYGISYVATWFLIRQGRDFAAARSSSGLLAAFGLWVSGLALAVSGLALVYFDPKRAGDYFGRNSQEANYLFVSLFSLLVFTCMEMATTSTEVSPSI